MPSNSMPCLQWNLQYEMYIIGISWPRLYANIHNWMCLQCTNNVFPFNQIEYDNDFVLACCIQPCNDLLSSDLIYNPFGSDLEEIDN